MAAIGRLDFTYGLKRLFELTGRFTPTLGEGLVPVVQIADMEDSPFAVALPWVVRALVPAGVSQNGWASVLFSGPATALISIDDIYVKGFGGTGTGFLVLPWTAASVPTLAGYTNQVAYCARQEEPLTRIVPEVSLGYGISASPLNAGAPRYYCGANESTHVSGRWALGREGALSIAYLNQNLSMDVAVHGRLHLTSAA